MTGASVFGIGFGELAVIAFVAVLVFGPDKLPDLAKQAGQFARKVRDFANNARDELRTELGPEFSDLELRDLDPRTIVRKHIVEAMEDDDDDDARQRTRRCGRSTPASGRRTTSRRPDAPVSLGALTAAAASASNGTRSTAVVAGERARRSRRPPGAASPSWREPSRRCSRHRSPASAIRRSAEPRPAA